MSESGTTRDVVALSAQDSFQEALRSDHVAGTEQLSAWMNTIQALHGIETLFELDTLLRGLRAFFDLRHLPLSEAERAASVTRSFAPEIEIARHVLGICERHTIEVVKLGWAAKVEFETFIEQQIRKDRVLDYHVSKILEQPTPTDSFGRLLDTLHDLAVIIDSLVDLPRQDLQLFLSLGRTYHRSLRECRYVDMLLAQRFLVQYDCIDNPVLGAMLRGIPEAGTRRSMALALLYLFRLLRYSKVVARDLARDRPLRHNLVVFSNLHREMGQLSDFVRARFGKGRRVGKSLRSAGELVIHLLTTDGRRVMTHELVFASSDQNADAIYTRIENSHGILSHCYQSCIVTLAQAVDPNIEGKALFPSMIVGLQEAQRLRQDLWQLRQDLKEVLAGVSEFDLTRTLGRLAEFRETSLRHLMYRDWGEFERISDALITAGSHAEARSQLRHFIAFLDQLVQEVSKRSIFREAGGNAELPVMNPGNGRD